MSDDRPGRRDDEDGAEPESSELRFLDESGPDAAEPETGPAPASDAPREPSPGEEPELRFLVEEPQPPETEATEPDEPAVALPPADSPPQEPPSDDEPSGDRPALERAREARAAAAELDDAAYRELWRDVLLTPLRRGALPGLLLLTGLVAWMSYLEGGATATDRQQNTLLQAVLGFVGLMVMGLYARRIMVCTFPRERPMPWFRDDQDPASLWSVASEFLTVVTIVSFPLFVAMTLKTLLDWPGLVEWGLVLACAMLAAAQLPFGLVGAVGKDSVLGALPPTVLRIVRAEPRASRIAAASALLFAGLFVLSFLLATLFNPENPNRDLGEGDTTALRTAGRVGLFVLRWFAAYAALVSFRVAGLLARDVPEVREILE